MVASVSSPPRILGRYALYEPIASGGMATVHFGRLLGPVGFARTVAIKRLHAQFAQDPEFVSMFLDEARLAARIRHPNVVPTLDVVALDGELFLVMEYVQGEPLGALLKATRKAGRKVPIPYAVAIISGALRGLHAAHEAKDEQGEPLGIVHRDISPQNILVGVDGAPRVLDFGVAKAAGRLQVTRQGQIKGKIAYMPPEQIHGTASDRRTDVYAAGAVLWETLTGVKLFQGDSDIAVFAKVMEGKVLPPSQLAPGVPAALDAIVMRALAKSPEDRFEDAREMARALESVVPLVATAEIGEWVEATAAEHLATRTQTVSRIEVDSAVSNPRADGLAAWPSSGPASVSATRLAPMAAGPPGADATEVSGSSASAVVESAVVPRIDRRWIAAGIGAGGGLLVFAIILAIVAGRSNPTSASTTIAPVAPSGLPAASPPALPVPPAPLPAAPPPPAASIRPPVVVAAPPLPAATLPPSPSPPAAATLAPTPPVPAPLPAAPTLGQTPTVAAQPPPARPRPPPAAHALDSVLDSRK